MILWHAAKYFNFILNYQQAKEKFQAKNPVDQGQEIDVIVYMGDMNHDQFAGPAPMEDIAKTIVTSIGPSGKNKDYLYNLAEAMKAIDPTDEHIFTLEKLVRDMESSQGWPTW